MSNHTASASTSTATATATATDTNDRLLSTLNSLSKSQLAIQSLSPILPSIPPLSTSSDPSLSLLHDSAVSAAISALLRSPTTRAGGDALCRWLYDTFQSGDPGLRLIVLCHTPLLVGAYLSRAALQRPLAGFEAVLLAHYAHETISRAGQPLTVTVPDMAHPSLFHEMTPSARSNSTTLNLSVVSPTLEPHGMVRFMRRARIVGVALELYYGKIHQMPKDSKLDFCHVCKSWAGDHSGA